MLTDAGRAKNTHAVSKNIFIIFGFNSLFYQVKAGNKRFYCSGYQSSYNRKYARLTMSRHIIHLQTHFFTSRRQFKILPQEAYSRQFF